MDSILKENLVGSKVSSECEHNSSVGERTIDKICDDVHQEASKSGNAGTSQHVENANSTSKNGSDDEPDYIGKQNIMDNSTNGGKIVGTRTYSVEKLSVVLNIEYMDKPLVEGSSSVQEETKNGVGSDVQQVTSGTSMVSMGNSQFEISEVSEINNVGKTSVGACSSAEMPAEDISHKDETAGNTDINVVGAADIQKNVEPSLLDEGCAEVNAMAQAESNMDALTDAVAAVESRNISSPDTPNVVQLPYETVAKADAVIEDQPRSPLLGVSLLHDDNKEIMEVGFISDDTFQKRAPEVEKATLSDGAENIVHGLAGDCDFSVGNLNVDPSEQTTDSNAGSLLDPMESMAGENGVEPLNLAVNVSVTQHDSVDAASPSECDTIPASVDKPQISFSDTKNNELSQSSKDNVEGTNGSMHENTPLSSMTKEDNNFTFKVNAKAGQNHSSSENMVSSVSSHGGQSDPIKLHEDSLVSQPSSTAATGAGSKGKTEQKSRKKSIGSETAKKSNHLKEQPPTRRSRKVGKSSPLLTPPGQVTPVSIPKPGGSTPISTSNLHNLNNTTSTFHHSFIDHQQFQLRAQILVYGSLLSGMPPEEPHMIAAFGESDGGRRAWEATWHTYLERVRGQKCQPNSPGSSTPDQGNNICSAQSKFLSGMSSPVVNSIIPISSPLWNIPTPGNGLQSIPTPFLSGISPLHPYQTPGVQNIAGNNSLWLPQSPFLGQWLASSPTAPFGARFSTLPITESVKLSTVKESGAPSIPVIPVGPSAGPAIYPMVSSDQPSSDPKGRKRKKVVGSQCTTSAALSPPISINSKSIPGNFISTISPAPTHDQPRHVDQTIERILTQEEIAIKIEESKVQAADAALHAAAAADQCEVVWSQLESRKNSGLVSDDEAKLASSAISIAAAASVAKVAAAAAKIASNVAEQARLMADEVFLASRKESHDQSSTSSIISAAKEAARRRIEAASSASKHAENLDAIVKAAELAAEAVSLAGKIVAVGNPLSLSELIEAGPKGWNSPQLSKLFNQEGYTDKQSIETVSNDKDGSGNITNNQTTVDGVSGSVRSYENDKSSASGHKGLNLSKTVGVISESEFGLVPSDVDQNMHQRASGTGNDIIIKKGCLVEVLKDDNKKKRAWFAANVLTLRDGKAFVRYTEIKSDEGSGKLKEWVPLEAEGQGSETPRLRIAHAMTTLQSLGTRKRNRTALTDYAWSSGDRVDVWVQNCWCEAVVVETNKNDITYVTVQFLGQGERSAVRSWHVRPTLIWKDGKWIEWSSLEGSHFTEGDTPHEKRQKFDTAVIEGKAEAKLSKTVDLVKLGMHQKSTRSGLVRENSRVVFGVPKPGKKQKFMNVSTHRVADAYDQNDIPNDSRGSRNNSKNNSKEKQVAEVKSKVINTRKPPIPSFKTLTRKDKLKPSKPTSRNASLSDEILPGQSNMTDFDSSNAVDAKETSTSKAVGKTAAADRKATKVLVKDKATSEVEPRRSVRRIQPTSRLLEGLQSSLTVSKPHSASHASQRSHKKVTSKG